MGVPLMGAGVRGGPRGSLRVSFMTDESVNGMENPLRPKPFIENGQIAATII